METSPRLRFYRYLHGVTAPDRTRVQWWDLFEIGLVGLGFLLYFIVRAAVVERTSDALDHARRIIDWQISVGLFIEPTINRWALETELWRVFNFVYFWMDFPLIVAVGLLLFWKRRPSYTLLRDSLLISGGMALIAYWAFPVAPPRFFPEFGFVDTMKHLSNLSYQAQSVETFVNPFAAVPSLHVGWTILLTYVVFKATTNLWARFAAAGLLTMQTIAVVATANHYIFDALAGVIVAVAALLIATWLQRRVYPAIHRRFAAHAEAHAAT